MDVYAYNKPIFSRHDSSVAHTNSQQQWLQTQDLHKEKLTENACIDGVVTYEILSLTEDLLTRDGCWKM